MCAVVLYGWSRLVSVSISPHQRIIIRVHKILSEYRDAGVLSDTAPSDSCLVVIIQS